MSTPLSIKQFAHNYTVYPEVPLQVSLPSPTTAKSLLALLVFGHRTNYGFNVGEESAETVAPVITDDGGNTWTLLKYILNIVQDYGTSPPVISPDASGNYPSIYLFVAPTSGNLKSGGTTVWVTDAGLDQSPPTVSPPIEFGRPVFDGGITAIAFELVGSLSGTPGPPIVDGLGLDIDTDDPLGRGIMNPNNQHEMVLEAGILLDSSAIGLGMASLSPPTLAAMYLNSGNIASSGSSCWIVQSTLHGADTDENAGFSNPGRYAGGVLAVAYG